jgi:hypothetical protein
MVWQEQETRTTCPEDKTAARKRCKKNGSPAFRTGRCTATERPLDGLAESEVRTETMETLRQLAVPACCASLRTCQLFPEIQHSLPARTGLSAKTR